MNWFGPGPFAPICETTEQIAALLAKILERG